jgi:amino acid transporter
LELSLEKSPISLVSATTIVAASMIGVGVYTTSGYTLAALGSPDRVIAAWIVGGFIAICGALGYGSLASRFTESGGEYMFLSRTLHPVAGLMAGWVSLFAGFTGAIAISAIGLEKYLSPMLPLHCGRCGVGRCGASHDRGAISRASPGCRGRIETADDRWFYRVCPRLTGQLARAFAAGG